MKIFCLLNCGIAGKPSYLFIVCSSLLQSLFLSTWMFVHYCHLLDTNRPAERLWLSSSGWFVKRI